jgi:hypothetical protein
VTATLSPMQQRLADQLTRNREKANPSAKCGNCGGPAKSNPAEFVVDVDKVTTRLCSKCGTEHMRAQVRAATKEQTAKSGG